MCEPHPHGGRRLVSSSGASTHNHRQLATYTHPSPPQPTTTNTATATASSWIASPISPPTSPPSPSCLHLGPFQHHPVDLLAHRLRNQSITRQTPGSTSSHHNPSAALSPASLADDNEFLNSTAMDMDVEIDPAEDDTLESTIPNRNQHRTCRKGLGITVPTLPSGPDNGIIQPSPSATDPAAAIRAQAESSGPTLYGPEYDLVCPELEVDEGYCEEEDDFSWLESVVSLRDVSTINSGTPEGIKKRYGLRYRTSTEAATRCTNAVHSVPRMRRRDKKRRKSSRLPDIAAIVATTIAT